MLTEEQQQIVNSEAQYVAVESCPGAGKTTIISWRIKYLLDLGIDPANILVCTFSRSQAEDMALRIFKVLRENGYPNIEESALARGFGNSGQVTTIHAASRRMLVSFYKDYGSKEIAPSWKERKIIETKVEQMGWTYYDSRTKKQQSVGWKGILYWINAAKNALIQWNRTFLQEFFDTAGTLSPNESYNLTSVALTYQKELDNFNAWTFADMLMLAELKFRDDPLFREYWQKRFTYVIVDECQDINNQAMRIIKMMQPQSLFVVGDGDQNIYAFQGSSPEINLRQGFDETYHGIRLPMTTNFRSQPNILKRADSLIINNYNEHNMQYKKLLRAREGFEAGKDLTFRWYSDCEVEADEIISDMYNAIGSGEAKPGDFMICGRLNAQMAPIEIELLMRGLPFVNLGVSSFFNAPIPKLVIEYMRQVVCRTSPEVFESKETRWESFRVVHNKASSAMHDKNGQYCSTRWLGDKFLDRLNPQAPDLIAEVIKHTNDLNAKGWAQWSRGANDIVYTFDQLSDFTLHHNAGSLVSALCKLVINDWLKDEYGVETDASESAEEDLAIVSELASRFTIADFLQYVKQLQAVKDVKPEHLKDYILLGTIHRFKGLERDRVYIVGCSERILPHRFSLGEQPPNDGLYIPVKTSVVDERNLMFVAVTRAIHECHCSGIQQWPTIKDSLQPSRFIYEMGLLERNV